MYEGYGLTGVKAAFNINETWSITKQVSEDGSNVNNGDNVTSTDIASDASSTTIKTPKDGTHKLDKHYLKVWNAKTEL